MSDNERTRHPLALLADGPVGEGGMLSLVSLFVVLGFLVLFSLLSNAGKTVGQKLEAQNAADAVAYSAGVEMARGLNSVTAANHLIGELQALVVLHHGLGGDELDGLARARRTPTDIQQSLQISYQLARVFSTGGTRPNASQYQEVRKEPD